MFLKNQNIKSALIDQKSLIPNNNFINISIILFFIKFFKYVFTIFAQLNV